MKWQTRKARAGSDDDDENNDEGGFCIMHSK